MINFFKKIIPKYFIRLVKKIVFITRGYIPWTMGYDEYKWSSISDVINNDNFNQMIGTKRFGYRVDERMVEISWLFNRLPAGHKTMLDAGSALNFLPILSHPKIADKKLYIATLAPESQAFWNMGVSYLYEDIRETLLKNNSFDVIACISTIEHIGLDNTFIYTSDAAKNETRDEDYLQFLDIMHDLLKPGGTLFLSFPYGQYKNHEWFQVFDAKRIDKMIKRFKPKEINESIFMYENDRWNKSDRINAAGSTCYDINVEKKYAPDYCAFSRGIACLEMKK